MNLKTKKQNTKSVILSKTPSVLLTGLLTVLLLSAYTFNGFISQTGGFYRNTESAGGNNAINSYTAFAAEGEDDKTKNLTFNLTGESRFFIVTTDDEKPSQEVIDTVSTADSQFAAESVPSAEPLDIVYGRESKTESGDIVIIIKDDIAGGNDAGGTKSPLSSEAADAADSDVDDSNEENINISVKPTDELISEQTFTLKSTDSGTIEVTATAADGLFYGLNTLLQKFINEGTQTAAFDLTQSPDTAERTVLLDCGRKYYSREWIENLVKRMSWQKYTSLELHFSDTHGMRFESKTFPWLNEPEGEYLTYDDLKSICETALAYHVEIIPDLDSPGHMDYIINKYVDYISKHPDYEFEYDGKTYSKDDSGFENISNYYKYNGAKSAYNNTGIDISNKVALAFTNALIDEYADFFAGYGFDKFNIGGDELFGWTGTTVGGRSFGYWELWDCMEHWSEYASDELGIKNGSAADAFISYLNTLASRLEDKGYKCRVWNDELNRVSDQHIELDKDIDIVYWSNDYTPMNDLAKNGNTIYNTNTGWCYYVLREDRNGGDIMDKTRKNCNSENIYKNWNPRNCANPGSKKTLIPQESFGGAYFAIWADDPDYKDQDTVWEDIKYRTWANSAKMWDNKINKTVKYKDFIKFVDKIGEFPGYSGESTETSALPASSEAAEIQLGFFEKIFDFIKGLFA